MASVPRTDPADTSGAALVGNYLVVEVGDKLYSLYEV